MKNSRIVAFFDLAKIISETLNFDRSSMIKQFLVQALLSSDAEIVEMSSFFPIIAGSKTVVVLNKSILAVFWDIENKVCTYLIILEGNVPPKTTKRMSIIKLKL